MPENSEICHVKSGLYHTKYIPQSKLISGLNAFYKMRVVGAAILNKYIARLAKQICIECAQDNHHTVIEKATQKHKASKKFTQRIKALRFYEKQFKRFKRRARNASSLSISFSAKRLGARDLYRNPRKYLSLLAADTVNAGRAHHISQDIQNVDYIDLFEPAMSFDAWENREVFLQNNIQIIDTQYLIYVFCRHHIFSLFSSLFLITQSLIKFKQYHQKIPNIRQLKELLASNFLQVAIYRLYQHQRDYVSYLYTSNSFSTEILRLYQLHDQNCQSICELMHGVSSLEYEAYLRELLTQSPSAGEKHSFVSQIPHFDLYGVFKSHYWPDKRIFVNTYLNRYLLENNLLSTSKDYLYQEAHKLINHSTTPVVSFVGAMSHDKDYFNSEAFRVERRLIELVEDFFEEKGQEICIVYTPHPGHAFVNFKQHSFFKKKQRYLYDKTILTWFIADICVSLHSSALYEAVYFGIKTFTPVNLEDGFYPQVLLDYIFEKEIDSNHPETKLIKFLQTLNVENSKSLDQKIAERSSQLFMEKDFQG
jgi:23S rRNA maturation mini-RNase III